MWRDDRSLRLLPPLPAQRVDEGSVLGTFVHAISSARAWPSGTSGW
jgi:hypothetical protein